jgi:hypothetical protein
VKTLRAHPLIAAALGLGLAYVLYRWATGRSPLGAGHTTPADAISYGWVVVQAGITGWLETSPDGATNVMHDTGWSDPYKAA